MPTISMFRGKLAVGSKASRFVQYRSFKIGAFMPKTVEYYLSKGFDSKAAAYFASGRRRPVSVIPKDSLQLLITFDNSEKRLFNMSPLVKDGTVYSILKDKSVFGRCYIDSTNSICWDKNPDIDSEKVWSNKIDLSADICYMDSEKVC